LCKLTRRAPYFYRRSGPQPPQNAILAALPPDEYWRVRACLEFIPLKSGAVLWEPNQPITFVYFPNSGMVSLVAVMRDGATVEVGMTGREGFVGTPVIAGTRTAPVGAIVQIAGHGFRMESDLLRKILPQTPQLEQMLHRYANAHAMQVAQAAACNRLHQVPERLSRWLAMSHDRAGSNLLPLTQRFLAQMLGCRRSSVTAAVSALQKARVIGGRRGQLRILNRKELQRRACECYSVMRRLSGPFPQR